MYQISFAGITIEGAQKWEEDSNARVTAEQITREINRLPDAAMPPP